MASIQPIYIFDLDGTLALIEHRRHHVERPQILVKGAHNSTQPDPSFKPNWKAFYADCVKDQPNWPVIALLQQLYSVGCEIRIWSGRSDEVMPQTVEWLFTYLGLQPHVAQRMLTMRKADDFTPDEQLKRKWLNLLSPAERSRIGGVFDDRDKVVDMWRNEGLLCCQVARGNF